MKISTTKNNSNLYTCISLDDLITLESYCFIFIFTSLTHDINGNKSDATNFFKSTTALSHYSPISNYSTDLHQCLRRNHSHGQQITQNGQTVSVFQRKNPPLLSFPINTLFFQAAFKVALETGWKITVIGDVLTTGDGIGVMIKSARLNLEPEYIIV